MKRSKMTPYELRQNLADKPELLENPEIRWYA